MKKAALLSTLVVAVLLAVGVMAQAQQQTKQPRIGFLFIGRKTNRIWKSFARECETWVM
jgi:hypothetical protein